MCVWVLKMTTEGLDLKSESWEETLRSKFIGEHKTCTVEV